MNATRSIVILLGAPGSGKGTQGRLLANALGALHISVGDLVRDSRERGERLPADPKTRLVDTSATLALIERAAASAAAGQMLILDGFPRHAGQVDAISRLPGVVACVVTLEVEFAEAIARMKARGRDGEDTGKIGLRHFHHEQSRGDLEAALRMAGYPVEPVPAGGNIASVQAAAAKVIHRFCGELGARGS